MTYEEMKLAADKYYRPSLSELRDGMNVPDTSKLNMKNSEEMIDCRSEEGITHQESCCNQTYKFRESERRPLLVNGFSNFLRSIAEVIKVSTINNLILNDCLEILKTPQSSLQDFINKLQELTPNNE